MKIPFEKIGVAALALSAFVFAGDEIVSLTEGAVSGLGEKAKSAGLIAVLIALGMFGTAYYASSRR